MEQHIEAGTPTERIGFISFTKKAVQEAIERAMQRFGLQQTDLPNFRTIHSLAFRQLALRRERTMSWRHYKELGEMLGLEFQGGRSLNDGADMYGMAAADRMSFLENLARIKKQSLRLTWEQANEPDQDWWQLEQYARALVSFKRNRGLLDFTDFLEAFVQDPRCAPKLDVLVVDEAQDTSPLAWGCIRMIMQGVPFVYFAGDDDQCVHHWAGADVQQLLSLPGEVLVLDQSYRVPSAIHPLATSITQQISRRQPKTWKPKVGDPGSVQYQMMPEDVGISRGTWMLLARNGYQLAQLEEWCEHEGFSFHSVGRSPLDAPSLKAIITWERLRKGQSVPREEADQVRKFCRRMPAAGRAQQNASLVNLADLHTPWTVQNAPIWHEALEKIPAREREFFIAARKRGETLTKKPRIQISTIHSVKGGEAENVLLLTDVSAKTYDTMQSDPDNENRVWYVGVTRASQNLHIIQPQTAYSMNLG